MAALALLGNGPSINENFIMAEILDFAAAVNDLEMMEYAIENMLFEERESTFNPNWPHFDLDSLPDALCKSNFRFYKDEIKEIARVLRVPAVISCRNRSIIEGVDALCMTLRRFVYPNRLCDLEEFFGRPKSVLSLAINETVDFLHQEHGHLLTYLNQPWMNLDHLNMYSEAIHDSGAPLDRCIGFIDGTVRPICRPIRFQRCVFNGHKRVHSLKFQSLTLPNGLMAHLWGPYEGRRHDAALLRESGLSEQLDELPRDENGQQFHVYGDPAYPVRPWLISPFRNDARGLNQYQLAFNAAMAAPRTAVEWTFGEILKYWAFVDFKKDLKVFLQPVGKYYLVAGLLTNVHTCIRDSQTGLYFNLEPPALEDYIGH